VSKKTPRDRYDSHKANAKKRGVEFKFLFSEWMKMWEESGHFKDRGKGKNKYCMARFGDVGAYEVGNVHIITNSENRKEWRITDKTRQILSVVRKGNRNNKQTEKTHCPHGHPYSGDNLLFRKDGARRCRACMTAWSKEQVLKKHQRKNHEQSFPSS
jgi:hypothetical protein